MMPSPPLEHLQLQFTDYESKVNTFDVTAKEI